MKLNVNTIIIVCLLGVVAYLFLTNKDDTTIPNELLIEQEQIKSEKKTLQKELKSMKDSLVIFKGQDSIYSRKDSIYSNRLDSIKDIQKNLERKLSEQNDEVNDLKKELEKIRNAKENKSPTNLYRDIKNEMKK